MEYIHGERFTSRAQMRETVFECIETDYNDQRCHRMLGTLARKLSRLECVPKPVSTIAGRDH
ncbi:IS3 family transposase [Pseudomonas asuensis]|uniref:Integrase catalytic domain-containing protein n=1 Tax=Pseudomonas asuensis TaxID=1825787 RepID=A0ABQ2H4G2_9PSED|nr:IS3 family transposase [Pseudomonas asuensis]GGM31677.1 hypothetical protein GCM10009425_47850 [Pseudomonas asuensis]